MCNSKYTVHSSTCNAIIIYLYDVKIPLYTLIYTTWFTPNFLFLFRRQRPKIPRDSSSTAKRHLFEHSVICTFVLFAFSATCTGTSTVPDLHTDCVLTTCGTPERYIHIYLYDLCLHQDVDPVTTLWIGQSWSFFSSQH